jgi:hypothetical protein
MLLKQFGELNGESVRDQFERAWKPQAGPARERAAE